VRVCGDEGFNSAHDLRHLLTNGSRTGIGKPS